MQSRQKHSILSLHKLMVKRLPESSDGTQNVSAGFHFVLTGAILRYGPTSLS
jgi:hypothetical protein